MKTLFLCSVAGVALGVSSAAQAQTAPAENSDVVVVTARKVEEELKDVPISITVIDAEEIRDRGALRLADLQYAIPNFSLNGTDTSIQPGITIRGVNISQRNIGIESGYGVYVDGVLAGRASAVDQDLLDIEQVEVLRGPQGTLFGKNTIAGAINIITRRPSSTFEAELTAELSSREGRLVQGRVSGPIVDGLLYGKISSSRVLQDGYIKNLTVPGEDPGNQDRWTTRGGLRFTPSEDFEINLLVDYLKEKRIEVRDTNLTETSNAFFAPTAALFPMIGPGPYTVRSNVVPTAKREVSGISLDAEYQRGGYAFTAISAFRSSRGSYGSDGDRRAVDIERFIGTLNEYQISQEVRVASPRLGDFDFVAGAYAFYQKAKGNSGVFAGPDLIALGLGPYAPNSYIVRPSGEVETRSFAVFGNANWHISDQLTANFGVRFTQEDKELLFNQQSQAPASAFFPNLVGYRDEVSADDVSPTASLVYEITPDLNAYATISRGFKSGGFNADFVSSLDIDFGDEEATNYEAGLKGEFFDGDLSAGLSLFNLDYKDLQVTQFIPNVGNFTTNAGAARSRGGELEFDWQLFEQFRFGGGVGYADAKYEDYILGTTQFGGKTMTLSPEWTGTLTGEYEVPLPSLDGEAYIRGDYAYRSETFFGPNNDVNSTTPSFENINLRVGLRSGPWEASAFVYNLADEEQQRTAYAGVVYGRGPALTSGTTGTFSQPRTFGIRISHRFE